MSGPSLRASNSNSTSFLSPGPPSTAFTSPDQQTSGYFAPFGSTLSIKEPGSNSNFPIGSGQIHANAQQQHTNFTPVAPMEDLDNEGGGYLAKVAEPDQDAFMQYAALVPEYCRLESLVVRAAV